MQVLTAALLAVVFIWSYWPTIAAQATVWASEPIDSPGLLIVIFCPFVVYFRRQTLPSFARASVQVYRTPHVWLGIGLVLIACCLRVVAAYWHAVWLDGWSILVWLSGAACYVAGAAWLMWSWPIFLLLGLALPLPWQIEQRFTVPLQTFTAKGCSWLLVCFNQPALAAGTNVMVGDTSFQVEESCSGLLLTQSVLAIAIGISAICDRPWWYRVFFFMLALPGAVFANVSRVAVTVLIARAQLLSDSSAHDVAGPLGIIVAAGYLVISAWWLDRCFQSSDVVSPNQRSQAILAGSVDQLPRPT